MGLSFFKLAQIRPRDKISWPWDFWWLRKIAFNTTPPLNTTSKHKPYSRKNDQTDLYYSHSYSWWKHTYFISHFGYINQSPIMCHLNIMLNCPPLDNGGPEMKYTYFHRNENLAMVSLLEKQHRIVCHMLDISVIRKKKRILEIKLEQAQRRAAADRSRHKSHGRIQYQGRYFLT